jgi:hypothetical protein
MVAATMGKTVRFQDGIEIVVDDSVLDEGMLYLRDLLVARVRIAHRGRRREELKQLDELVLSVIDDIRTILPMVYAAD